MRMSAARRRDVPLMVDVAIGLVLVAVATFYIVVTEYYVGNGELTRAELLLLDTKVRVAHAPTRTDNKKIDQETQGELKWPKVEHN